MSVKRYKLISWESGMQIARKMKRNTKIVISVFVLRRENMSGL